jgi:diamine N-acetyltransferase
MLRLEGNTIFLRALEPEDLTFLYKIENDISVWEVSETQTPYSKFVLKQYLDNAHRDIYEVKQLRLVICNTNSTAAGFVDLFDFDPKNRRSGVGIVVLQEERRRGVAGDALKTLVAYAFKTLNLHQLYAGIRSDNKASIALFTKLGFVQTGIKKDWILTSEGFKDELLFQKIDTDDVL